LNDAAAAADLLTINELDLSDTNLAESSEDTQIPLNFGDSAKPLSNPKHDRFLQLIAQGASRSLAYQEAVNPTATRKTATEQASRLVKRGSYQARLRFLILEAKGREGRRGVKVGGAVLGGGGSLVDAATGEILAGGGMTKGRYVELLERLVEESPNEQTRLAAGEKLAKIRNWIKDPNAKKEEIPDPVFMAAYLRRAQKLNVDPVALAEAERSKTTAGDDEAGEAGETSGNVETKEVKNTL
jgi:hypothetical protein